MKAYIHNIILHRETRGFLERLVASLAARALGPALVHGLLLRPKVIERWAHSPLCGARYTAGHNSALAVYCCAARLYLLEQRHTRRAHAHLAQHCAVGSSRSAIVAGCWLPSVLLKPFTTSLSSRCASISVPPSGQSTHKAAHGHTSRQCARLRWSWSLQSTASCTSGTPPTACRSDEPPLPGTPRAPSRATVRRQCHPRGK